MVSKTQENLKKSLTKNSFKESTSIKVQPQAPTVLSASGSASGPGKSGCLMQVAHDHPLRNSELNHDKHNFNLQMEMLRNREGLHAPLKIGMELFACKQVGRLPFLKSR